MTNQIDSIVMNAIGKYGEPTTVLRVPVSAASNVMDFVTMLARKNAQTSTSNVIEIMEYQRPTLDISLPLFSSKVAAGFPSPADDHIEKRIQPNSFLIENESATFCLRVKGDSMVDAGIFENDVLIVDRSKRAQVGDIVLAVLDGEFTVKTLGRSKAGPRLIPANKHYAVIDIKEGQYFEIWGVVTGSMRKFK